VSPRLSGVCPPFPFARILRAAAPTDKARDLDKSDGWASLPPSRLKFIQLAAPRTTGWTAATARRNVRTMRRSNFDPLEIGNAPTWLVVRNLHRAVLEVRPLPTGADLKRAFVAAMLDWIDAGWEIKEFSSRTGVFFCDHGVDRRMVEITPSNPGRVQSGGIPQLPHCASCDD
jgi:hypothetical protein